MMKMKMKLLVMAGAMTMASLATPAMAQTASGGTVTFNGPNDYTSIGGLITLFNPAAGTLTGVTLTSNYNFDSEITVTASTGATGNVDTQSAQQIFSTNTAVNSALTAALDTTSAVIGSSSLNPAEFNITGNKSSFSFPGGTVGQFSSSGSGTKTITLTAANQLAAFYASTNMSTAGIGFQTLTGLNSTIQDGSAAITQITNSTDTFSVLYTYAANAPVVTAAVPEIGTWAMMIVGLGMVGGAMRRRRSDVTTRVQFA